MAEAIARAVVNYKAMVDAPKSAESSGSGAATPKKPATPASSLATKSPATNSGTDKRR